MNTYENTFQPSDPNVLNQNKYTATFGDRGQRIMSTYAASPQEADAEFERRFNREGRRDIFTRWNDDGRKMIVNDDPGEIVTAGCNVATSDFVPEVTYTTRKVEVVVLTIKVYAADLDNDDEILERAGNIELDYQLDSLLSEGNAIGQLSVMPHIVNGIATVKARFEIPLD